MVESIIKSFDIWTDAQGVKSKGRVKNIDNISLEGIAHLRELILELAVRGKLVAQNASDEPASALLKKIEKEKGKPLSEIKAEEKLFALPNEWVICRLGEVGFTQTGATPSTNDSENFGDYIPFIGPGDLNDGTVCYDNNGLSKKGLAKGRLIEKNSILMVCIGGSIGKARIVDRDVSCNQQINTITCYKNILHDYVYIALLSPYFQKQIIEKATGSATPIINKGKWENIPIPLPPLAEQHRIVDKVAELMALCDELEKEKTANLKTHQTLVAALLQTLTTAKDADEVEKAWHRLAPHFDTLFCTEDSIDQLKQAILQLAVMGRLVNQNPADEPASELLKKIETEKKQLIKLGKLKSQGVYPNVLDNEKQYQLPNGWEFVRFGNVTFNRDAERIPLSVEERSGRKGDYDYYGASGVIDKINDFIFEKPLLLIGEDGANLINRSTPIAFIAQGKYWVNNHAHVIDGISEDFLNYLCLHINAISLLPYITGTAQPKMNQAKMNSIVLALPPLTEQHCIVAKVEELMALCDQLKKVLLKSQEIQINLSKTIVENAVA